MGIAVVVAVVVFTVFGLMRWAEIMRRHRVHQDRVASGLDEAEAAATIAAASARTTVWFAVRTTDVRDVARVLGLRTARPVPFAEGMQAAKTGLFVAPAGAAFVMAIGIDAWHRGDLPQVETALRRLSEAHGEAFWFLVDADRDCMGWAFARRGEMQRAFSFDGSEEQVLWELGEMTAAERDLGFFVEDARDLTEDAIKWWPLPTDVRSLASRWSVDPARLADPGQPGLAGRW